MISQAILELAEELVDPSEAFLDDQVEEAIETEDEIMLGVDDVDDDVIDFIDRGKRLTNSDPVDFTDDDVDDLLYADEYNE